MSSFSDFLRRRQGTFPSQIILTSLVSPGWEPVATCWWRSTACQKDTSWGHSSRRIPGSRRTPSPADCRGRCSGNPVAGAARRLVAAVLPTCSRRPGWSGPPPAGRRSGPPCSKFIEKVRSCGGNRNQMKTYYHIYEEIIYQCLVIFWGIRVATCLFPAETSLKTDGGPPGMYVFKVFWFLKFIR